MSTFFERHNTKRTNQTISNITFLYRTNSNDFHWHMTHVQQFSQQFTTTLCDTLGVGTFTPYSTTPSVRSNHRLAMRISLMYFGSSSESDGLRVVFLLSARSRSNSSLRPIFLICQSGPSSPMTLCHHWGSLPSFGVATSLLCENNGRTAKPYQGAAILSED